MQNMVVAVVGSRGVVSCPALLTRLDAMLAAGELHRVVSGGRGGRGRPGGPLGDGCGCGAAGTAARLPRPRPRPRR
ncbi:hypothetical protein [Hymenobacter coccineus]|uniref:hypothetical protein n=1 Tax=Hymenobacter coccineus TaxID=1908235 RepID=UPI001EFBF6F5